MNYPFTVGVGIDVGEPVEVDGDYIGNALNRAARITASALGGQILVTELVRGLVETSEELAFLDLGTRSFRGFAEGMHIYEVRSA